MKYLNRRIALPSDHGSWVFLLSPLLIGLFAAGNWSSASLYLVVASIAAFLIRQPISTVIKVISGRRPKRDLHPAIFWTCVYSLIGITAILGLLLKGFGYILYLTIPGVPVFSWHLYLVSRRAERRKAGVEIVGSGVLALSAPAAYWVGVKFPDPTGWWLFFLTWFQSAASIVYAYLRLKQREMDTKSRLSTRMQMARRSLLYTTFNVTTVTILSIFRYLPLLLPIAYTIQWVENVYGALNPAIGKKPTRIGIRQLIISTLFTIVFIITWRI